MSVEREVEIVNESGLHMRPGKLFVNEAKKYNSTITVTKNGVACNAKSLIKLMKAGIGKGDRVTLTAEGEDEEKALTELTEYIAKMEG